jgi:ElaB/YqjD/DUF883 family membrane-anchored ribosome-binding protein
MVNTSALRENWDHLRKQILHKWSQFAEGDLVDFEGTTDELIARIQAKTGESRESIENFLETSSAEGATMVERVKERVSDNFSAARKKAVEGYHRMQSRVGDTVYDRPAMSVTAAFGLGLLAGFALSLVLFDVEPEPARRYSRNAEKYGRRFWNALAENLPDSIAQRIS